MNNIIKCFVCFFFVVMLFSCASAQNVTIGLSPYPYDIFSTIVNSFKPGTGQNTNEAERKTEPRLQLGANTNLFAVGLEARFWLSERIGLQLEGGSATGMLGGNFPYEKELILIKINGDYNRRHSLMGGITQGSYNNVVIGLIGEWFDGATYKGIRIGFPFFINFSIGFNII